MNCNFDKLTFYSLMMIIISFFFLIANRNDMNHMDDNDLNSFILLFKYNKELYDDLINIKS